MWFELAWGQSPAGSLIPWAGLAEIYPARAAEPRQMATTQLCCPSNGDCGALGNRVLPRRQRVPTSSLLQQQRRVLPQEIPTLTAVA